MNEVARSALARFREIGELLASPEVLSSVGRLRELGKERAELEELATAAEEYERLEKALAEAREILAGSDPDLRELAEAEAAEIAPRLEELAERLRVLSIPKDPDDSRNAIVEVRAGM